MQQPRLLVGIPAYGGEIRTNLVASLLGLQDVMRSHVGAMSMQFIEDALLPRARDALAALALKQNCTHLLMIDADMGFDPRMLIRWLAFDKPIIAGSYPMKRFAFDEVEPRALKHGRDIRSHALRFTGEPADKSLLNNPAVTFDGFMNLDRVGTGIILIHTDAFRDVIRTGQVREYRTSRHGNVLGDAPRHDFFGLLYDETTQEYLGEDYSFCERYRRSGGTEIWCDFRSAFSHTGPTTYQGSGETSLKARFPEPGQA